MRLTNPVKVNVYTLKKKKLSWPLEKKKSS